jgi:hypothetical protein
LAVSSSGARLADCVVVPLERITDCRAGVVPGGDVLSSRLTAPEPATVTVLVMPLAPALASTVPELEIAVTGEDEAVADGEFDVTGGFVGTKFPPPEQAATTTAVTAMQAAMRTGITKNLRDSK